MTEATFSETNGLRPSIFALGDTTNRNYQNKQYFNKVPKNSFKIFYICLSLVEIKDPN